MLAWGCFAAMGIAAVVATSAEAFTAVKLVGAVVLVVLGLQSLRGHRDDPARPGRVRGAPLRDGLVTSLANPKLAVFFVALFPQFVPDGAPVRAHRDDAHGRDRHISRARRNLSGACCAPSSPSRRSPRC